MLRKEKIRIAMTVFFAIAVISFVVSLGIKFNQSTDPHASLGEWENVHDWRKRGECLECHSSHDYVAKDILETDKNIPAAKYHSEVFRKYTHGRMENITVESCYSCHQTNSCKDCHSNRPETHTMDFTNPTGSSQGMEEHIMLGRIRPSSCLVCHKSFVSDCTNCHTQEEAEKWQKSGDEVLLKWTKKFRNSSPLYKPLEGMK